MASPQPTPPLVGRTIDRYRILSPLGKGGMGEVYLAEDSALARPVAIKFLSPALADDQERLRRFLLEARTLSSLNHPNIVTMYDVGESEVGRFLAMEYIDGRPLSDLVGTPPPARDLVRIGAQTADALKAAHAAGVLHRDIKPGNVMVRHDGWVKVLDFGLARVERPGLPDASTVTGLLTTPGAIVGTVRYMSPEQALGARLDSATDLFSLGITLFELATGQHPFAADTSVAMLLAITAQVPPVPSSLNPDIPPEVDALILRMLDKLPQARPTAEEASTILWQSGGSAATTRPVLVRTTARRTVGRLLERQAIVDAFEECAGGRGSIVGIAGEPGIGKTTLVEDFLGELAAAGTPCRVARGRASERLTETAAYLPFLDALDALTHGPSGDVAKRALKTTAPAWLVQVASGSSDSANAVAGEVRVATPERLRRELIALVRELTSDRPLVLFLDDLHWADRSTTDMLAHVAAEIGSMRLLVLVTYRPGDLARRAHPLLDLKLDLQARTLFRELALGFLTLDDVDRYLALEFPLHAFPASFAQFIHAKTEGSPLFITDLVRYLRRRGVIAEVDGRWTVGDLTRDMEHDFPESVRSMIARTLAQLDDEQRRLLVAASVQGAEFDAATIGDALKVDVADVEERLAGLERTQPLVARAGEFEFPDRTLTVRYRFVHALYQNSLYATLGPARRASLSSSIAQALVTRYRHHAPRLAAQIAPLFETARDFARAAEYYVIAARNAMMLTASSEAGALARRGLHAAAALEDSPAADGLRAHLQLLLGGSLVLLESYGSPQVERAFQEASATVDRLGDPALRFVVDYNLHWVYLSRCEAARAWEQAERLLAIATAAGQPSLLLEAHSAAYGAAMIAGDMRRAREHAEAAVAIYDPAVHQAQALVFGVDKGPFTRSHLAIMLWVLGFPDQARASLATALAMAEASPHLVTRGLVLMDGILVRQWCGEHLAAAHDADRLVALASEHGLQMLVWAQCLQGWTRATLGQLEEGIAIMRRSIEQQLATGTSVMVPAFSMHLGSLLGAAGRPDDAIAVVDTALAFANPDRSAEPELHRVKGELLLKRDPDATGEAAAAFERALEVARERHLPSWELRAAMSLARLEARQGRTEAARSRLKPVYDSFTEGFGTADLIEARSLLDACQ